MQDPATSAAIVPLRTAKTIFTQSFAAKNGNFFRRYKFGKFLFKKVSQYLGVLLTGPQVAFRVNDPLAVPANTGPEIQVPVITVADHAIFNRYRNVHGNAQFAGLLIRPVTSVQGPVNEDPS
jgi:hypothetical protein